MTCEVIHGATPLENEWAAVQPRLYLTPARLAALRRRIREWPAAYKPLLAALCAQADKAAAAGCPAAGQTAGRDIRGCGCTMANLALAAVLTGERRYRDAAFAFMRATAGYPPWRSLGFGHLAHGYAVAFDWLNRDMPAADRAAAAEGLRGQVQGAFEEWARFREFGAFAYTCNHFPVGLAGLTAAAGALYGHVDNGPAAWLKMAAEKAQLAALALGPDGVSPEGIGYGQYYTEFLFKTFALLHDLAGVDLFTRSAWCRNHPRNLLYHTFPRAAWKPHKAFFQFGDSPGSHWYGPGAMLRRCAAVFRDGRAQWLADETRAAGANADSAVFLDVLWHDPTVLPVPPKGLPGFAHFADMGMVFMRSGWTGGESVLALRGGPCGGHHAAGRFRHNICGGHMHPAAGAVQLFARGEPLVVHTGYTRKWTAHASTVLINGRGQVGEGGDWFEDLEFRKGRAAPAILAAAGGRGLDYACADLTPAYPDEAGLVRLHRHVVFVKPDAWLIVDDLAAAKPVRYEALFHVAAPAAPAGAAAFTVRTGKAGLTVQALGPAALTGRADRVKIEMMHAGDDGESDRIVFSTRRPVRRLTAVLALGAFAAAREPRMDARLTPDARGLTVEIRRGARKIRAVWRRAAGGPLAWQG